MQVRTWSPSRQMDGWHNGPSRKALNTRTWWSSRGCTVVQSPTRRSHSINNKGLPSSTQRLRLSSPAGPPACVSTSAQRIPTCECALKLLVCFLTTNPFRVGSKSIWLGYRERTTVNCQDQTWASWSAIPGAVTQKQLLVHLLMTHKSSFRWSCTLVPVMGRAPCKSRS